MKKTFFLSILFLIAMCSCSSSVKQAGAFDDLKNAAAEKVAYMQKIIGFTSKEAKRLEQIEFQYLAKNQKAENCKSCNAENVRQKAKNQKDRAIGKILPRDQFIKYLSVENQQIKINPQWLPPRQKMPPVKDSLNFQ